jgi:hypothetical protein
MSSKTTLGGLAAATLLLAASCTGTDLGGGTSGDGSAAAPDVLPTIAFDEEPGLSHVHGLGINPADGQLYVATHFGLWQVDPDGGQAQRIGEHFLDLMGFTVAGEDHFLASGHPPMTDELPPHLGLIETTDAGRTWRSVSLLGAADFHALRFQDGVVYGWNTTDSAFLVSDDDGASWQERSQTEVLDFALDPADADHILATSPDGPGEMTVRRTSDGGRSWEQVPDVPELARIAWSPDGWLVAVGPGGDVWIGDDANTWELRSSIDGFPEALLAIDDAVYAAADGALIVSRDRGESWDEILRYN